MLWVYTGCEAAEFEVIWVFYCRVSGAMMGTWSCEQMESSDLDLMVALASVYPVATGFSSGDSRS